MDRQPVSMATWHVPVACQQPSVARQPPSLARWHPSLAGQPPSAARWHHSLASRQAVMVTWPRPVTRSPFGKTFVVCNTLRRER
jgi:hypothetical protein